MAPSSPQAAPGTGPAPFIPPGAVGSLERPSERPDEPVTHGAALGAGPGPEALGLNGPATGGAMTQLLNRAAIASREAPRWPRWPRRSQPKAVDVAASATPLPPAQPLNQQDLAPLDLMLAIASGSTNATNPDAVIGAAHTSATPDEAVTNAQAIAGFTNAAKAKLQLQAENGTNQQQYFDQLNVKEQDQLHSVGYSPPNKQGGFFHDLWHVGEDVLHNRVVGDVSNILGAPLRAAQHVERTWYDVLGPASSALALVAGAAEGQQMPSLGSMVSPEHWARAWDETNNGEKYIDPTFKAQAQKMFDPETYQLALKMATGQAVPINQQTDHVTAAANFLQAGHISLGRVVAGSLMGIIGGGHAGRNNTKSNALYRDISGGVDAFVDFFADPTVWGGKFATGLHAAHYAVQNADDLKALYASSGSVRRAIDVLNERVQGARVKGGLSDVARDLRSGAHAGNERALADYVEKLGQPQLADQLRYATDPTEIDHIADQVQQVSDAQQGAGHALELSKRLSNAGIVDMLIANKDIRSSADILDWFGEQANWKALAQGESLAAGNPIQAPHLTYVGQKVMAAKGGLHKAMNFAGEDAVSERIDPADLGSGPMRDLPFLQPRGLDRITVGGGRLVSRAYRLVPIPRTFNPNSPNALPIFRDWLSMFMKPANVDKFVTELARSPDVGAKWEVVHSAKLTMARLAGFTPNTDEWDSFMSKYVSDVDRKYAPNGEDVVAGPGGVKMGTAVGKSQLNDNWLLPSFKDMYLGGKKLGVTQALTKAVNVNFLTYFMNIWRPITLARLGFATRVGGEEAANFILREGVIKYLRGQGASVIARSVLHNQEVMTALTEGRALEAKAANLAKFGKSLNPEEVTKVQAMKDIVGTSHGQLYNMLRSGLTDDEAAKAHNIADLYARKLARSVHNVMIKGAYALTPDLYRKYVWELINRGELEPGGVLHDALTAHHGYDPPNESDIKTLPLIANKEGKSLPGEFDYSRFTGHNPAEGDNIYRTIWARSLNQAASDDWMRPALMWTKTEGEKVQDIADVLQADPAWKQMSRRAWFDRQGRSVDAGEITERQAAEDHANAIVATVNSLVKSHKTGDWLNIEADPANEALPIWQRAVKGPQTGVPIVTGAGRKEEPLAAYLLREGQAPPWFASDALRAEGKVGHLASIPIEDMPHDVAGPEYVPALKRGYDPRKLTNKIFQKVIAPQIDWLSRTPIGLHNYPAAREEMAQWEHDMVEEGMKEDGAKEEVVKQLASDRAHEAARGRAINSTINYVHNPELRSGMSSVTRNLAPFWFAQEQFYKRWARTFIYSPWSFRQASLISNGLQHMGFIHTNPADGQEYFVYPGSALVTDAIARVMTTVGWSASVPVAADLIGEVSMLSAGMGRGFMPSPGPAVVVPMDALRSVFPRTARIVDALEGGQASAASVWTSIVPATVAHAIEAIPGVGQIADKAGWASAEMSAIQYLEATGHGLGEPATNLIGQLHVGQKPPTDTRAYRPGDYFAGDDGKMYVLQPGGQWEDNSVEKQQEYMHRVQNFTNILMVTRLLYGFAAPAAPINYFNPKGYSAQLQKLMQQMPANEAMAAFLKMHPDATAMTVFQSQTTMGMPSTEHLGEYLPATQAAMQFLNANPKLVKDHALAAVYFLPAADTKGKFDTAAYQQQFGDGLRQQKNPGDYWTEIAYQEAANFYYNVEGYKSRLVASNAITSQQGNQLWVQFSQKFMASNPLFASMYSDQGEKTRQDIMNDVGAAIRDRTAPVNLQTAAVAKLYQAYSNWQSLTTYYGQQNAPSSAQAEQLNEQFAVLVSQFEKQNPSVQPLVQRVIAPDLLSATTALAAQGIAVSF